MAVPRMRATAVAVRRIMGDRLEGEASTIDIAKCRDWK
jgi:hypothetical protein